MQLNELNNKSNVIQWKIDGMSILPKQIKAFKFEKEYFNSILDGELIKHNKFGSFINFKDINSKFPLLTTKKMYFKGIVTELIWFFLCGVE